MRTRRTRSVLRRNPSDFFSFLGFDNPRNFDFRQVRRTWRRRRFSIRKIFDFRAVIRPEAGECDRSYDLKHEKNCIAILRGFSIRKIFDFRGIHKSPEEERISMQILDPSHQPAHTLIIPRYPPLP